MCKEFYLALRDREAKKSREEADVRTKLYNQDAELSRDESEKKKKLRKRSTARMQIHVDEFEACRTDSNKIHAENLFCFNQSHWTNITEILQAIFQYAST